METIKFSSFNIPQKKDERKISTRTMYRVLMIIPMVLLILGVLCDTPINIWEGIKTIQQSNDVLLTDYIEIAGISATFVNAAMVTFANIIILKKLDLRPNGIIVSAIFLMTGFAFMGKNLFNIWPFYLGGLIYAKYHRIPYKNVVIMNMLTTTLSPLASILVLTVSNINPILSFCITAIVSGFLGFIMPPISAHMLTAHRGYSLYNMGFAGGLLGIVVYAIITGLGYEIPKNTALYRTPNLFLSIVFSGFCLILIGIGYYLNGRSFKGLKEIFKHPGRIVTDMIKSVGFGLTLVNMGLLGFMAISYTFLMGGVLNGPTIAGILVVMGFGAFGKHLKNTLPILVGVTLCSMFVGTNLEPTLIIISGLFGTTLAPIAGEFGMIWGVVVGMIHLALTLNIGTLHGGINLYNNGLSGGIIATLFIPMIDAFKREKHT